MGGWILCEVNCTSTLFQFSICDGEEYLNGIERFRCSITEPRRMQRRMDGGTAPSGGAAVVVVFVAARSGGSYGNL